MTSLRLSSLHAKNTQLKYCNQCPLNKIMSVSVSQKFVHFWVKTGKREGSFFIYIKQGRIHNKSNSIWVKKPVCCEVNLGSHFIPELKYLT